MGGKRITSIKIVADSKDMELAGIYKIYSSLHPEKFYIGSACNFRIRLRNHRSCLHRNIHCSPKLQNYVNKYGADILVFEIIEIIENIQILLEREQYFIDELKPYFNTILSAITAGRIGHEVSQKTRNKISEANKGNKYGVGHVVSKEHREKLRKLYTGRKISEEQREFLRTINTGVKQPKEQIVKRMISILGEDRIKKVRDIQMYFDSDREKEKKYGDEIKHLSEKYGFSRVIIRNIKNGKMYSNFKNHEL